MNKKQFYAYIKSIGFVFISPKKYQNGEYTLYVGLAPWGLDITLRKGDELVHDSQTYLDFYGYVEYNKLFR